MCKFNPKNDSRRIDPCMKIFIKSLNKCGVKTVASCCGHGKYPKTTLIEDKFGIIEIFSGTAIARKRKFYKKDKEGIYFIPGVEKEDLYENK